MKLRQIQRLIAQLPSDETVVFQDEVDVHLNPKIGPCWMVRGEQAEVVTPGNNEKRHLAGSLHWRTGRLLLSAPARRRNAALFVAHLDDLRRQLRGYRVIHVVCDNASFHDCRAVREFLARHPAGSCCTTCRSTRPRPIPSSGSGGICTRRSPATTAAERSTNCWPRSTNGPHAQGDFYRQTVSFRNTYKLAA